MLDKNPERAAAAERARRKPPLADHLGVRLARLAGTSDPEAPTEFLGAVQWWHVAVVERHPFLPIARTSHLFGEVRRAALKFTNAAQDLCRELKKLRRSTRLPFGMQAASMSYLFDHTIEDTADLLHHLSSLAKQAKIWKDRTGPSRGRQRKVDKKAYVGIGELVFQLQFVALVTGGRLRLDAKNWKGNLIEAIDMIRADLPALADLGSGLTDHPDYPAIKDAVERYGSLLPFALGDHPLAVYKGALERAKAEVQLVCGDDWESLPVDVRKDRARKAAAVSRKKIERARKKFR